MSHRSRIAAIAVSCGLLAAFLGLALGGCGGEQQGVAASSSPDPVVLLVDGRQVHRSDIDAVQAELRLGGDSGTESKVEEEAVRRELVRQEAARLGVEVDTAEVADRRAVMAAQLGGDAALEAALEGARMTDAQLLQSLEDGVLYEQLQNARFAELSATGRQARAYYDDHRDEFKQVAAIHLRSILVAAERIAESALGRLRTGRPFEEVARQFSRDPEAKAQGGDNGWVTLDSLPEPLRKAAAAAKVGEVSEPVPGPGGWYLLEVVARRQAGITPFAKAKAPIVEELTRRRRFKALEDWLDGAREKATISEP